MTNQEAASEQKSAADDDGVIVSAEEDTDEAPMLERRETGDVNSLKRAIFNVPIEVTVSVGSARPLIGELLSMGRNHLLPLDSAIDDPVELKVKGKVIARGELTQLPDEDGRLGVRVTEVVNISGLKGE